MTQFDEAHVRFGRGYAVAQMVVADVDDARLDELAAAEREREVDLGVVLDDALREDVLSPKRGPQRARRHRAVDPEDVEVHLRRRDARHAAEDDAPNGDVGDAGAMSHADDAVRAALDLAAQRGVQLPV
eukprot:CAMPEP_0197399132 /NCGR_PEP_ID=MMETSP1165-20131217/14629_1 /TAXON_ID=284809 /ORGANISM="Chrysocystis fragilis, Strain CCMP3189" /LENGTH=128 /DNA_ID=CAMNT_0042925121 /DNA_START=2 /DNA_END=384 /DNA_ORIENTATION=+